MAHLKRILLVEDDESLRTLYKEEFLHNNFEVIEAEDGQLGIDYALQYKPDIILLDLMLPRQGGLGVLRILRSMPETKTMPIIILTALPNPEYQAMAKDRVSGFYLKTKITPAELLAKVQAVLKEK